MKSLYSLVALSERKEMGYLNISEFVSARGSQASVPKAYLTEGGQLLLSKAATEKFGSAIKTTEVDGKEKKKIETLFDWDPKTRTLRILAAAVANPDKETGHLVTVSSSHQFTQTFAGALRSMGYDYKASGTQQLEVTEILRKGKTAKGEIVERFWGWSIVIPSGSLTPTPKRKRNTKQSVAATPAKDEEIVDESGLELDAPDAPDEEEEIDMSVESEEELEDLDGEEEIEEEPKPAPTKKGAKKTAKK